MARPPNGASNDGSKKMEQPMTLPTTREVRAQNPRPRRAAVGVPSSVSADDRGELPLTRQRSSGSISVPALPATIRSMSARAPIAAGWPVADEFACRGNLGPCCRGKA